MKPIILLRFLIGAMAMLLLAGLSGCTETAPDASQLLSQAQQKLSSLDSYAVRMSVDIRATPASGDQMAETSIALDTYTQVTTACQAMTRSSRYTVYKDWLWSLVSSQEYQFPGDNGMSDYYYTYQDPDYYHQQRQTIDYRLELSSFFGSDVTATATRYDGKKAYLLTGSLDDAHLEQLLPPDGAVVEVLRQIPLTATVTSYLDKETLEPLNLVITCSDPDGTVREVLNCPDGTLNICRISLSFSSFNGLEALEPPEMLASATELASDWYGLPRDAQNAVILEYGETQVHIPVPVTYTPINLASTPASMVLQKFCDGHTEDITYQITEDDVLLHQAQQKTDSYAASSNYDNIRTGIVAPVFVNGRTVAGEYVAYIHTDEKQKTTTYRVEYSLWTQLDSGAWLQCSILSYTAREEKFKIDGAGYAELLFGQIS